MQREKNFKKTEMDKKEKQAKGFALMLNDPGPHESGGFSTHLK